ncbi:MarR family transcriptional regulator [Carbonactinospora thermoautotrophica]|uniref:MarR family winged helix-turn-helix transcriptional regulator n=1 Tax=Carbonactinospora thermoautotrophica TaxID=1469144 RepID=UPI002271E026|nr:MarR family transcriptional regulator [Carbonactinospora thermoautotrophica]MCX9189901.1 MarR family transcriptional regulator [Carbonactinospora thermoautotrophica]
MNARELLLLGRKLVDIAMSELRDTTDPRLSSGEVAVVADVLQHPDSTIGEITARTGFAQSRVSTAVARLRALGALETVPDPADRRRTLVRPPDQVRAVIAERVQRPVDDALRRLLRDQPAEQATQLLDALDGLYQALVVGYEEPETVPVLLPYRPYGQPEDTHRTRPERQRP